MFNLLPVDILRTNFEKLCLTVNSFSLPHLCPKCKKTWTQILFFSTTSETLTFASSPNFYVHILHYITALRSPSYGIRKRLTALTWCSISHSLPHCPESIRHAVGYIPWSSVMFILGRFEEILLNFHNAIFNSAIIPPDLTYYPGQEDRQASS